MKKPINRKPERHLLVHVVDQKGRPAARKSRVAGSDELVTVLVINRDGRLLQSAEWNVRRIARGVERARMHGASDVLLARDLSQMGQEAKDAVYEEIMNALKRVRK